jgi:hypothetical protein
MTTIHPVGLATLIDNREPLDSLMSGRKKNSKAFTLPARDRFR